MRNLVTVALLLMLLLGLNACTSIIPYHKPDIQQGNVIAQTQVNKLKKGMSKQQVIAILGAPLVKPAFITNQLSYIYTNKVNRGKYTQKRLILQFKHDKLVSGMGDFKLPF